MIEIRTAQDLRTHSVMADVDEIIQDLAYKITMETGIDVVIDELEAREDLSFGNSCDTEAIRSIAYYIAERFSELEDMKVEAF